MAAGAGCFVPAMERQAACEYDVYRAHSEQIRPCKAKEESREYVDRSVREEAGADQKYNAGMLGVDKSDQLIGSYNVLMKSLRWWKTLFFHCIDIAVVNSFIMFSEHRRQHPEVPELSRSLHFDQLAFRLELIDQLLGYDEPHIADP